ncbi:SPLICEOSOME-ASSOCIATED PROTEIN 62 (SPLICING FACTOR 3A SUBUNIT 2) [Encephalitozoon cuniculi GB-M1]|uniref:SPLICEOSOME-ASSOCIATED PROTEIN 62 (SPLICING FACTOR 3A SUBUNIT 2) n=1 Tax=Encephalitozoon cuniculi (strain GB-M1) TaxID=284813 RepID=Q8SSB4_ENCCU|nr:splicing factor 3a subunit 2 [Encephalitozoon cuniculi GB-M1]KMV66412.1 splicing factor 3a subunit 2 [Encephalitozoon cuniculi EcunIII-L]UYI28039.1 splicing factor 3A subunit [Encephalitozoon cuniculi]CAD26194.1 SPLICEOSOME-ASSOCIATED PROTEIN 62 (SPLICING FACTOR 3A SUBUNIT 2) [Encephalitozoon cuniculi GB-M1]
MGGRGGSKTGNAHTASEIKKHKKERSRQLLLEAYGLMDDPSLSRDSTGKYVCLLCKTKHLTEMSYVKHREGKKHKEASSAKEENQRSIPSYSVRSLVEGGRRGHGIVVNYELAEEMPQYRFVNSLEQNVEEYDESFRYLVFVCRPYENIGFKFENKEIDELSIYEDVDEETGTYTLHFYFLEAGP